MSRELEFSITSSQTTIRVSTTLNQAEFPIPGVIQIGSEKIRYDNLTNREFIGCTRGYLNTVAVAHAMEDDVTYVSSVPHIATTVESVKADNEAELVGDVRLVSGTNIALTQVGQEITIDATGSGVSWPLTATDYLDMDGNTLHLSQADGAMIDYDASNFGGIVIKSESTNAILCVPGETELYSNCAIDGSGNWNPTINMASAGYVQIANDGSQGVDGNRNVRIQMENGLDVGFHSQMVFDANPVSGVEIGYDADGTTKTGTRIRGTNLTIESLGFSVENAIKTDASNVAGDTRLLLWDVDSGALVRVSVGANDSGGTGFKVLRIPN